MPTMTVTKISNGVMVAALAAKVNHQLGEMNFCWTCRTTTLPTGEREEGQIP